VYVPASFRMSDQEARAFVRQHNFAVMTGPGPGAEPWATHLPLLLRSPTAEYPLGTLAGHMARANPHWKTLDGQPVLAVFAGSHAYINPAWYESWPTVPTWNYEAVHASGVFHLVDGPALVAMIKELVAFFDPSSPILKDFQNPYYQRELEAIVGFEIVLTRLVGKKKLGQNRSAAERRRAAAGLRALGDPASQAVANLMEATVKPDDPRS
jgi:transcriptional regulator